MQVKNVNVKIIGNCFDEFREAGISYNNILAKLLAYLVPGNFLSKLTNGRKLVNCVLMPLLLPMGTYFRHVVSQMWIGLQSVSVVFDSASDPLNSALLMWGTDKVNMCPDGGFRAGC